MPWPKFGTVLDLTDLCNAVPRTNFFSRCSLLCVVGPCAADLLSSEFLVLSVLVLSVLVLSSLGLSSLVLSGAGVQTPGSVCVALSTVRRRHCV